MGILNPFGLGVYKSTTNKEKRQEKRHQKDLEDQAKLLGTIHRLREKSKGKSSLKNLLSNRSRIISIYDMVNANKPKPVEWGVVKKDNQ